MNKKIFYSIRFLTRLYVAGYVIYFLYVGYQLFLARPPTLQSTVPVLSKNLLTSDAKALESRFVLPTGVQYTATTSGVFGRSEPFN